MQDPPGVGVWAWVRDFWQAFAVVLFLLALGIIQRLGIFFPTRKEWTTDQAARVEHDRRVEARLSKLEAGRESTDKHIQTLTGAIERMAGEMASMNEHGPRPLQTIVDRLGSIEGRLSEHGVHIRYLAERRRDIDNEGHR